MRELLALAKARLEVPQYVAQTGGQGSRIDCDKVWVDTRILQSQSETAAFFNYRTNADRCMQSHCVLSLVHGGTCEISIVEQCELEGGRIKT